MEPKAQEIFFFFLVEVGMQSVNFKKTTTPLPRSYAVPLFMLHILFLPLSFHNKVIAFNPS